MEESLPVVFVFDKMDCYHRDAFIHAHLPFIVVGIQLYLPFMGIYLQEKYIKEIKTSDTFQPLQSYCSSTGIISRKIVFT